MAENELGHNVGGIRISTTAQCANNHQASALTISNLVKPCIDVSLLCNSTLKCMNVSLLSLIIITYLGLYLLG